jgi:hypothetical protein
MSKAVTRRLEGAMHDTYEEMYRELTSAPVPNEGLVLPNSILTGVGRERSGASEPTTQQERLLRDFCAFLVAASAAWHGDTMTLAQKQERPSPTSGDRRAASAGSPSQRRG